MGTNLPETKPVEQLFLDLPIQDVLNNDAGMQTKDRESQTAFSTIRNMLIFEAVK